MNVALDLVNSLRKDPWKEEPQALGFIASSTRYVTQNLFGYVKWR